MLDQPRAVRSPPPALRLALPPDPARSPPSPTLCRHRHRGRVGPLRPGPETWPRLGEGAGFGLGRDARRGRTAQAAQFAAVVEDVVRTTMDRVGLERRLAWPDGRREFCPSEV